MISRLFLLPTMEITAMETASVSVGTGYRPYILRNR